MTTRKSRTGEIVVIGGGSWGGALADQLLKAKNSVTVLTRSQETADALKQARLVTLPQVRLKQPVSSTIHPECLGSAELVLIAVPVSATTQAIQLVRSYASKKAIILFTGKGLLPHPQKGGVFLPEWVNESLGEFNPYGLLSGPSFADEVISDKPAAVMIASNSVSLSGVIADYFSMSCLRCYVGDDIIGVAVGGAIKNIIAIAAGIATGLELGDNARAALVTRGLAEISRLAVKIGGKSKTLNGLAGMGDLMLSCSGPHSRNMGYGMALARKQEPEKKLAEGSKAAALLNARAAYEDIELPIAQSVYRILQHPETIEQEIRELLSRAVNIE